MKVYRFYSEHDDYESYETTIGIFSTYELAEAALNHYFKGAENNGTYRNGEPFIRYKMDELFIQEFTVDQYTIENLSPLALVMSEDKNV